MVELLPNRNALLGGLEGVGAVLLGGEHTAGGGYVLATGGSHGCGDA